MSASRISRAVPGHASLRSVIEIRGVLGSVVQNLGCRIVGGEWAEGGVLPIEADLAKELKVSRSVIREAMRILGAKGLIRSRTSDGTRVLPRTTWRLLDPDVMEWHIQAGDQRSLLTELLRVRMVLEPGVAYTATLLATPEHRERVRQAWLAKVALEAQTSLSLEEKYRRFVQTDLEFHRLFFVAAGSELLEQLFSVIEAALELMIRLQASAKGYPFALLGTQESLAAHEAVYDAFMARDAPAAEQATRALVASAAEDAEAGFKLVE